MDAGRGPDDSFEAIQPEGKAPGTSAGSSGGPTDGEVLIIANRKSGTNRRDAEAIDRAAEVFGRDRTRIVLWDTDESLSRLLDRELAKGGDWVVAAGGDGTAMAVAQAMLGRGVPLAVLPLGTFNYFSRGLGQPEDPDEAARAILTGRAHDIRIGTVNDRVFLNNASLGIYPAILKERETVYARFGRRRIMAHWSVVKTFLKFQRPMRMVLEWDGQKRSVKTPLLFAARSSYQLSRFGLNGAGAIRDDQIAFLVGRGSSRWELFRLAWRLVTRRMREGRDYDLIRTEAMTIDTGKRTLLAYDGEKSREPAPFRFAMSDDTLTILLPDGGGRAEEEAA